MAWIEWLAWALLTLAAGCALMLVAILLGGCGESLPEPNYPPTAEERTLMQRLETKWVEHGYTRPDPDCMDGLRVAMVSRDVFEDRCWRVFEEADGSARPWWVVDSDASPPSCPLCSGGWLLAPRCTPVTVMLEEHAEHRLSLFRHELVHHFERCAGFGYDFGHQRAYWSEILD